MKKRFGFLTFAVLLVGIATSVFAAGQNEGENVTKSGVIYQAPESVFDANRPSSRNSVLSPRAIQLKYQENEEDNGKMLATWETSVVSLLPERQGKFFPICESLDYGETWTEVGRVVETQRQDWSGEWEIENCPHIFELPADVGEMKKGGIVVFGDICPRDLSQTHLDMYYSEDMGRTWEFMSTVVDDGGANYMEATPGPVWEPFILYDPDSEALICYYSDERDPKYGQKLVLQYTTDGENWSEVIDVVAQTDTAMRPGMPIVTQMENGHYVMVFEGVGLNYWGAGLPCNYKISLYPNDPIHWDAEDIGFTFGYGGSPYVATLPSGHIVMNCSDNSEVFINTQKDLSGDFIKYPAGVPNGYNRQLIPIDDGTECGALFTLSCEFPDTGRANSIKWGKLDLNTVTIPDTYAIQYAIYTDTEEMVNIWPSEGDVKEGADQYFMVEPKRGCELKQIYVNGEPADLQTSWFKVPYVTEDIEITVDAVHTSEDARLIRSKEESQYYLCPPGYSMEDGREIFEWTWENHLNFYWEIQPGKIEGTYLIQNKNNGMYLSAKDVDLAPKANVIQKRVADDSSLWIIKEEEDGWYSLINCETRLAITRGNMGDFGTPTERFAVQKPYKGTDDQLWGIEYVLELVDTYDVQISDDIKNGSISASFGEEAEGAVVFLTVTPDEGYQLKEGSIKVNGVAIQHYSFEMPAEDVVVTAEFQRIGAVDLPYEDVAEDDWFYEAVEYTYVEGLMTGMDDTHFGPYGQLSRAQFALILYRMEGSPNVDTKKTFDDITGEEWYGSAVLWAAENSIVTGYVDGNFGPSDMITREQMALMMYRYAKYLEQDVDTKADFDTFKDANSVSSFAEEAMSWAVGNGIITGKDNSTLLDPQGNTARSEAALIIQRFMFR